MPPPAAPNGSEPDGRSGEIAPGRMLGRGVRGVPSERFQDRSRFPACCSEQNPVRDLHGRTAHGNNAFLQRLPGILPHQLRPAGAADGEVRQQFGRTPSAVAASAGQPSGQDRLKSFSSHSKSSAVKPP